jgi:hypothetical protein
MFLGILSWMLSHVPGFFKPAVNWLVDGLRKITGHIAAVWNALGHAVGALFNAVALFRAFIVGFAVTVANGFWWVRNVYIPARLGVLQATLVQLVNWAMATAQDAALALIRAVERWVADRLRELGEWVAGIYAWALHQLASITDLLTALVNALRHVMSGPGHLAEWLLAAMIDALLRRLYTERDRLFNWVFTRSAAFTVWIARQLEDMIVRLL